MLTSLPAVTVSLTFNGHPGYVQVTSRSGLAVGAEVSLASTSINKSNLKVINIVGLSVYLWDPSTQSDYDASGFLIANDATLNQAAQDLYGGLPRNYINDNSDIITPLNTAELTAILLQLLPTAAAPASSVTVTNFPAQQHAIVDNTVGVTLAATQNNGTITASGNNITMALGSWTSASFSVSGTWSGTILFKASFDGGGSYVSIETYNPVTGLTQTQTTANGVFEPLDLAGATHIQAIGSAWSTGTASVYASGTLAAGTHFGPTFATPGLAVPTFGEMVGGSDGTDFRALSVDSVGRLAVNVNGTVPVSGTFFQATQPVSAASLPLPTGASTSALQTSGNASLTSIAASVAGTLAVSAASLPLPTGAATSANQTNGSQSTQVVNGANTLAVDASGHATVNVSGTVPVSGTFFQATQPVSAVSLPLPTGAATQTTLASVLSALQGTLTTSVTGSVAVTGTFFQATQPVSAVSLPLPTGAATQTTLASVLSALQGTLTTSVSNFPATQPVSAVSLPLPTGAATSANQTNGTQQTQIVQGGNTLAIDASGHPTVNVTGTVTTAGNKSVNAAAPGSTNIGTLSAQANAAVQTWTEGFQEPLSVDLSGNLRVHDSYLNATTTDPYIGQSGIVSRIVLPIEHLSAFGEFLVTQKTCIVPLNFNYSLNPFFVTTSTNTTGTATQANGMAVLQTGTGAAGSATLESKASIRYIAGTGQYASFTAMFTTGAANSQQEIGLGDINNGMFIAYVGTAFGVIERDGGVDTFVPQSSFNVDKCDGTGNSGFTISKTSLALYKCEFGWHGSGPLKYYVMDVVHGRWILMHVIGVNVTQPRFLNPTLPLHVRVVNSGNTSNITLQTASMGAYHESSSPGGALDVPADASPGSAGNNSHTSTTTESAVITLQDLSTVFSGQVNKVRVQIKGISIGNQTATQTTIWRLVQNTTLGGTPSYTAFDANTSVAATDVAGTTLSGGREVWRGVLSGTAESGQIIDLTGYNLILNPSDTYTLSCTTAAFPNQTVNGSIQWKELFAG